MSLTEIFRKYDPEKQMIITYGFETDMVDQYRFGEEVPVGIYDGFFIKIEE